MLREALVAICFRSPQDPVVEGLNLEKFEESRIIRKQEILLAETFCVYIIMSLA